MAQRPMGESSPLPDKAKCTGFPHPEERWKEAGGSSRLHDSENIIQSVMLYCFRKVRLICCVPVLQATIETSRNQC